MRAHLAILMNTEVDTMPGIPGPGKWIVAFLVFVLLLSAAVVWLFLSESARIQRDRYEDLAAISKLKVRWIVDWRNRFIHGAGELAGNRAFAESAAELSRNPNDPAIRKTVEGWLLHQIKWTGDDAMALYAPDGRLMLAAGAIEECP